jgi:hypothetical protein
MTTPLVAFTNRGGAMLNFAFWAFSEVRIASVHYRKGALTSSLLCR